MLCGQGREEEGGTVPRQEGDPGALAGPGLVVRSRQDSACTDGPRA